VAGRDVSAVVPSSRAVPVAIFIPVPVDPAIDLLLERGPGNENVFFVQVEILISVQDKVSNLPGNRVDQERFDFANLLASPGLEPVPVKVIKTVQRMLVEVFPDPVFVREIYLIWIIPGIR
jgi:hypothetical protein